MNWGLAYSVKFWGVVTICWLYARSVQWCLSVFLSYSDPLHLSALWETAQVFYWDEVSHHGRPQQLGKNNALHQDGPATQPQVEGNMTSFLFNLIIKTVPF